jgi:NitT/TauT family transport system substrate-binding protein
MSSRRPRNVIATLNRHGQEEIMKSILRCAIAAVLTTLAAAPAFGQAKVDPVNLRFSWIGSGEYAMYPYAIKNGFYEKNGIDLKILEGNGSVPVIQSIGAGTDHFADVDLPTTVALISKGVPVRIIAGLTSRTPASIIFFEEKGIKTPKDLEGKKVGMVAGDANHMLFPLFMNRNNVDPSKVQQIFFDPRGRNTALMIGQVDAMGGYWTNDIPRIEDTAKKKVSAFRYTDYGVNMLSRALIVNVKNLGQRDLNCRMVRATLQAWREAAANPDEAAQLLVQTYPKAGSIEINRTQWANNTTLIGKGTISKEEFENVLNVQKTHGGLQTTRPLNEYYTNEFVGC